MYYFLSDDAYFLRGIKESSFGKEESINFVHLGDIYPAFHPSPGDVVVISIQNLHARSAISEPDTLAHCKVIIILPYSAFVTGPTEGKFPWLLPYYLDIETLTKYLKDARSAPYNMRVISEQERWIINGLSAGFSVSHLASEAAVSDKGLYKSRGNLFTKLGLKGNNAVLTLACRDINNIVCHSLTIRKRKFSKNVCPLSCGAPASHAEPANLNPVHSAALVNAAPLPP